MNASMNVFPAYSPHLSIKPDLGFALIYPVHLPVLPSRTDVRRAGRWCFGVSGVRKQELSA